MQWVRALSKRKRESTAEVSLRRVALLAGTPSLIYLISAEIEKCVATK
jgi:hypothetical protein